MAADEGRVTQITIVEPDAGQMEKALEVMRERAGFMSRQPGFVSIRLHRSKDGDKIVNCVEWQNADLLQKAHKSPEFRKEWNAFDRMTEQIEPHLYEVALEISAD